MKGDFTRTTFKPENHYRAVNKQQGRVDLDADWNEQLDITAHRVETGALDVIGRCGAPIHDAGFGIVTDPADLPPDQQAAAAALLPLQPGDFILSAGRLYAHGILCQNESPLKFTGQPDLPGAEPLESTGLYLAYLDVWFRHLTALDDPAIREVALGGPDTATRTKTVWQVKLFRIGSSGTTANCSSDIPGWEAEIAPGTGKLAARTQVEETTDTPCVIAPGAGYRRLENQLYRVEVHEAGNHGTATFKWSRDNGSIVVKWESQSGDDLIVSSLGRDEVLGFAAGQWVELIDDTHQLLAKPGVLVKIKKAENRTLTIDPATATGSVDINDFPSNPQIRRWDSASALKIETPSANGGWLKLEDGVEARFSTGSYKTGDYWLIPARTNTGDVEWPRDTANLPLALPPKGIAHHHCRLALLEFDGTDLTITDCRNLFPPLTEIEDPDKEHKKHNRYLHGWGVVCGLQVRCDDKSRKQVRIEKGYALACDGTDICMNSAARFEVVDRAKKLKLIDANGNGGACLTLHYDANDKPVFDLRARPADEETSVLKKILEGTLLMDAYEECLKPVIDFLRKQILDAPAKDERLVPESTRRRIAALNLLIQLVNKTQGRRVFLSKREHDLLQKLYEEIRDFLDIRSFCAMLDQLPQFPAYPFPNIDIDTAFGKGGLSRVRVRPDGQFAYAFDEPNASTVYAFDVAKGELVAELTLPSVSGMQVAVTDVAFFTANGKPRVLVAASGNAGSVLVQYDGANHKPVANGRTILQGKKITRLAGTPLDTRHLYAAVKREGLFRFNPESFGIADFRQPMAAFNATGHLDVAGPFACATAASGDAQTETDTYDRIALIRIGNEQADAQFISLNDPDGNRATGTDGLSMVFSAARTDIRLSRRAAAGDFSQGAFAYVTVNAKVNQTQKRLLAVDLLRGTVNAEIPLGTSGPVRSAPAFNHSFLMVSMAEDFRMLWIDPRTNKVSPAQSLPLQMYPLDLATAPAGQQSIVIAANRVSNTLTLIPGRDIGAEPPLDVSALETYRDNLLAAFFQLLLRLGQQVKDCLCDHLLVDCPVCDDDDLIVLACIEIQAGQVHHVCNFSRHEVITFPKLKYWLSAVPVIPFVTWGIEKFCCSILSELFSDATKGRNDLVSSRTLGAATERANLVRFSAAASEQLSRMRLLGGHVFESSKAKAVARPVAAAESGVRTAEVLHLSPDAATRTLSDSGVEVARVAEYDEALRGSAIKDIREVPTRVQPGEKLNLFTREGKVVFYTIAREEPAVVVGTARAEARPSAGGTVAPAPSTSAAPAATRDELAALKVELDALKKSHKAELAARDKELAALKASTTAMKTDLTKLKRAGGGTTGRTRG